MSRGKPEHAAESGFLSRWARRKQQAREGRLDAEEPVAAEPAAAAADDAPAGEAVDEAALSDAELLARYELPDPESLTAADDVAAFMRKGVPARLRSLALRRIWRLDPVLANLDGLNDYDEDYTDAAMLVGAVKTVYQVGKGGAAHLEAAADRMAAADGTHSPSATGEAEEVEAQEAEVQEAEAQEGGTHEGGTHENVIEAAGEAAPAVAGRPPEATDAGRRNAEAAPEVPARRRRMVFAAPDAAGLHTASPDSDN